MTRIQPLRPVVVLRVSVFAAISMLLLFSTPRPSSAATGDVLANFLAPNTDTDSGRGLTFDGDFLYWTPRSDPAAPDTKIYKLDVNGNLIGTIQTNPAINFWGIAWDGAQLWGTDGAEDPAGREQFYTIDRQTGAASLRFEVDLSAASCSGFRNVYGLAYDFDTGTLWGTNTQGGPIFNVSRTGQVIRSFTTSSTECVTGVATNGDTLWLFIANNNPPDFSPRRFQQVSFTGSPQASFGVNRFYMDMEFDPISFAPKCAIWITNTFEVSPPFVFPSRIFALEAPCSESGHDASHYGSASSRASAFSADPVNLIFGNFTHSQTDLTIPTRGLPLEFTRSYNSASGQQDGPVGFGWTHNYNMKLEFESASTVIVHQPDGRRDRYSSLGGGQYLSPPDVSDTLTQSGALFTLTTARQVKYSFESAGKLIAIADRNGNTTDVLYFTSGPDVGRLEKVREPTLRELTFAYFPSGKIMRISDPLPSPATRTIEFTYDPSGNIATVKDAKGGITTYTYTNHLLETVTDSNSHLAVQNCYDPVTNKVAKQFAAPPVPQSCALTRDTLPPGIRMTEFLYNIPGPGQTTLRDPRATPGNLTGFDTVYEYDNYFRITKETDAQGGVTEYSYDQSSNRTCIKDPNGNRTAFSYDSKSNVIQKIDPTFTTASCELAAGGKVWSYTYTPFNDAETETDPLNRQTEYRYDLVGNQTRIIRRETPGPTGIIKSLTCAQYNGFGQPIATVESTNLIVPEDVTAPCTGNKTVFEYNDPQGNRTGIVNPRFSQAGTPKSTFAYDAGGRLKSATDELGHTTSYDYDPQNNITKIFNALRQILGAPEMGLQCGPNGTGNGMDDEIPGDGRVDDGCPSTLYTYDAKGNLKTVTDANGAKTEYNYDTADRLQNVLDAGQGLTIYGYDLNSNRDSATNARNKTSTYLYDALNRLKSSTDPLGHTTLFFYDFAGNLTKRADGNHGPIGIPETGADCGAGTGNGQNEDGDGRADDGCPNTLFEYDALTRLKKLSHWNGPTQMDFVEYLYDEVGNRKKMTDPAGVTDYTSYDALNRVQNIIYPGANAVAYTYDDLPDGLAADYPGQRTKITYPDPTKSVSYTYEPDGKMKTVTDWVPAQTTYTYDNAGRLMKTEYLSPGVFTDYSYDDADRLTTVANSNASGLISSFTFTLDAVGNRLRSVDQVGAATNYKYDGLQRLSCVWPGASSPDCPNVPGRNQYSYDPVGNRTAKDATTYDYDDADRMTLAGSASYGYDDNGNQTSRDLSPVFPGVDNFTYDGENRLSKVVLSDGHDPQNCYDLAGDGFVDTADIVPLTNLFGLVEAFYNLNQDPNNFVDTGDIAQVTGQFSLSCPSRFTYDGDGLRVGRSGSYLNWKYVWDSTGGLPVILNETDSHYTADGDATNNTYVYGLDLISVTDRSGAQTYFLNDGLGSTVNLTDAAGIKTATYAYDAFGEMLPSSTGGAANEFRFTGEQRDPQEGGREFYYLRARYYDPTVGRFLAPDPLPPLVLDPRTINPYPYVRNNPVNRIDPFGLLSEGTLFEGLDDLWKAKSCGDAIGNIILGFAFIVAGALMWTAPSPSLFVGSAAVVAGLLMFIRGYQGYLDNC